MVFSKTIFKENHMAKLLVEYLDSQSLDVLSEVNEEKKKTYRIKGPFIQSEIKNKNGRKYSKALIEREVKKINEDKISKNGLVGETDHPASPVVSLQNVSHLIESLVMDGNDAIGSAKLLDTPNGRIVAACLDGGVRMMVSTRGIGTVTESAGQDWKTVNPDFKLITIDCVSDGSAPGAVVEAILEQKEWMISGQDYIEVAVDKLQEQVDTKFNSSLATMYLKQFIQSIRKGN
jgi:hypothetical protein